MSKQFVTMPPSLATYNGGKGGSGTYQAIINLMPYHTHYYEPFLGGGKVMFHKLPARVNAGSDLDRSIINAWKTENPDFHDEQTEFPKFYFVECDAIQMLDEILNKGDYHSSLIYLDPPYPIDTRSGKKNLYKEESSDELHAKMLARVLLFKNTHVMISTYDNAIYREMLAGWHKTQFMSTTRQGQKLETVYMNFEPPTVLHDYRYLGKDFRQRERIRKRIKREIDKLLRLPAQERNAILEAIKSVRDPAAP